MGTTEHQAADAQLAHDGTNTRCWNRIGVWGDKSCPELRSYSHCRTCPVYTTAAVQLLDRPTLDGYREMWTARIAQSPSSVTLGTTSVIAFRIGSEWLALPASVLHGAAERRPVHSVPHRRGAVTLGLANVDGELLICVSLAALIGAPPPAPSATKDEIAGQSRIYERLLIVNSDQGRIVFPVDEVYGIHRYHPHELRDVPETLMKAETRFTLGLLPWNDTVLACLDDGLLFYAINKGIT